LGYLPSLQILAEKGKKKIIIAINIYFGKHRKRKIKVLPRPKSPILMILARFKKMLLGFKSRCTIPLAWIKATPFTTC
jgi:hypothetical protein